MMKIAVLITCHNRRDTTMRCLRSLLPQLTVDDSLFIVDDGSTDGTESAIKGLLYAASPMVKIISGDGSLFWAKGMNLAWNMAVTEYYRYDFYLWLNDDVVLQNDAITGLTNDWKLTGDSFSVIVGACASDETLKHSSYGATNGSDERIIPNGVGPRSASGWFNGNVVLVPHRTFLSIGMISPDYSHGKADYDYAERLRRSGIPFYCSSRYVGYCSDVESRHLSNGCLYDRLKMLFRPGRYNLKDLLVFRKRYYGYGRAFISALHLVYLVAKG